MSVPRRPESWIPVVAVGLTLAWITWAHDLSSPLSHAVLGGALVAHGVTLFLAYRGRVMALRPALILVAVALALAVLAPLHQSRDLYLYDVYGRAVAEHDRNPYLTAPEELGDDPVLEMVAEAWHAQESLYGPAFVGAAAVISEVAGTSELGIRVVWQALAAAAAMGAVVLLARRGAGAAAVLALGASPVLLLAVNDAHNDVLVGLGLLVVVLLADDSRFAAAGGVAALTLAIKLVVAVPLAGLAWWLFVRRGTVAITRFAAPVIAAVTTAYLLVGGPAALLPLRENAGDDSRFAIWQPLRNTRFEELTALGWRRVEVLEVVRDEMAGWALLTVLVAVAVVAWRFRRATRPAEMAVATGLVVLVASVYVMPWYAAMLAPAGALVLRSRVFVLAWVQGAFLVMAYADGPGSDPTSWLGRLAEQRAPLVGVVLLVALVLWATPSSQRRRLSPRRLPTLDAATPVRVPQVS